MRYRMHEWQHLGLKAYFGIMTEAIKWQGHIIAGSYPVSRHQAAFNSAANDNGTRSFNFGVVDIDGKQTQIHEDVIIEKEFASLVRFRRDSKRNDPKVLIVVPTSGHYPTLLRDFVAALLPDNDVYLTNWKNARDVSHSGDEFGLEDYLAYTQEFIRHVGPDLHVIGYSQSTIPVLSSIALMAARKKDIKPLSMTLMAGPIDTRAAQSILTDFAYKKDLQWFRDNALAVVPSPHKGAGRVVYPGVYSINPLHKTKSCMDLFNAILRHDGTEVRRIERFEEEHERVSDVHGKLYMDMVHHYFQQHSLPRGQLSWRGEKVDPSRITKTPLMTIEAGNDSITAAGQTLPAHGLCTGLQESQHYHHMQSGIDHYGIITGVKSEREIIPRIAAFMRESAARNGLNHDKPLTRLIIPAAIDPAPQKRYLDAVNLSNGTSRNGSAPRFGT